ncbi:hypothetical protein H113_07181 [Trichophyton rubrum MR1459]|nr:hypothetical protein H113_07181 [Trichophyton rubrum MR1459]
MTNLVAWRLVGLETLSWRRVYWTFLRRNRNLQHIQLSLQRSTDKRKADSLTTTTCTSHLPIHLLDPLVITGASLKEQERAPQHRASRCLYSIDHTCPMATY